MAKKTIAEKKLDLRNRFKSIMKALDEQGQEMLQALLDEIEALYSASDEEGGAELVAALEAKVEELKAKLPEGEAASAETVQAVEEEVKKLNTAIANLKNGDTGRVGAKSIREQIREKADEIKGLRANKNASLTMEVKAPMTTGANITSDPRYLPMPELDNEIGRIVNPVRTVLQDVNVSTTSANRIAYVDELPKNGDAAFIKEGTLKPQVDFSWKSAYADVKKVAMTTKLSTEMLEDIEFVEGEVERLARETVEIKIGKEILSGDGVDPNLLGITTQVGGFITPAYSGSVSNPNTADILMVAASQIWDLGYTGRLTAYLNSSEINKMKLVKDANGNYMSFGTILENIDIKPNPDLTAGAFLIGDFSKVNVKMRKDLTLEWGYGTVEDADGKVKSDWEMNFTTLRCEARLAEYIKTNDLKAFVYDNLATVKADIEVATAP